MKQLPGIGAALLLGWGLVAAPIFHQFVGHAHRDEPVLYKPRALSLKPVKRGSPKHSHGAPRRPGAPGEHGAGSLEHGRALLHAAPATPTLTLLALALPTPHFDRPSQPPLIERPRVEQPQGP
ncbi:MAG: hypothetical protein IPJ65_29620 [Archangiaceae bacterium]|nr:hypothetical protein [Archangiaceae bacterium]